MVPFFVALLQSLFRGFAERLILPDVLKKVSLTCKLSQLDRKDESIQKRTYEVSFSIVYDLCVLKNEGQMTNFKMNIFKTEVKNIYVHPMQPLISLLAQLISDSCEKWLCNLFKNWLMESQLHLLQQMMQRKNFKSSYKMLSEKIKLYFITRIPTCTFLMNFTWNN